MGTLVKLEQSKDSKTLRLFTFSRRRVTPVLNIKISSNYSTRKVQSVYINKKIYYEIIIENT